MLGRGIANALRKAILSSVAEGTAAKGGTNALDKAGDAAKVLNAGDLLRIENAATRIGKPVNVVGSRAAGTAKAGSDWDYVINGISSKDWSKIKNSLPGAKSIMDNTPRNIDLIKTPLDKTRPYITIHPRTK